MESVLVAHLQYTDGRFFRDNLRSHTKSVNGFWRKLFGVFGVEEFVSLESCLEGTHILRIGKVVVKVVVVDDLVKETEGFSSPVAVHLANITEDSRISVGRSNNVLDCSHFFTIKIGLYSLYFTTFNLYY